MRVLLIEDQTRTVEYLRQGLAEEGFIVDLARTGVDGRHLALTGDYDAIILDVMLPQMDGWQILQELRREDTETPVIMLTARAQLEDRVKGLNLGADDYLAKPFAFSELLARLRSVLRRGKTLRAEVLTVADLELDFVRRRVRRGGKHIELTVKEFALLALLLRHAGEVLSRTRIAEQVWDMNFDSDTNIVDVAVRRLRAKIDEGFSSKLIHTLRGVGYVLEARKDAE